MNDFVPCRADVLNAPERIFGLVGVATLIAEIFGLFGNAISFGALINRYLKRDVFRFFLKALCLADMGTLVCALFMFTIPEFVLTSAPNYELLSIVNTMILITFPIGQMLKTCSSWLVALMSLYRFVYVKYPLTFAKYGQRDTARAAIASVFIFAFLINVTRIFELAKVPCFLPGNRRFSLLEPTILRNSSLYQIGYHVLATSMVRFVLPLSMILFSNCYLIGVLVRSNKFRAGVSNQKQNATNLLLMTVAFTFTVCNFFSFLATCLEIAEKYNTVPHAAYSTVTDVSNFLNVLNASVNFLIYLTFNKRFRNVVINTLAHTVRSAARRRSNSGSRGGVNIT